MRAQPDETLDGDDSTAPDESPFLRTDVLLVEVGAQVISQEYGPDDGERPYVGMIVQWERRIQFGRLDLRVVDERRHGRSGDGGPRWRRQETRPDKKVERVEIKGYLEAIHGQNVAIKHSSASKLVRRRCRSNRGTLSCAEAEKEMMKAKWMSWCLRSVHFFAEHQATAADGGNGQSPPTLAAG
jgi:hypothetical protein